MSHAAWCVCLLVTTTSPAKPAEQIDMTFHSPVLRTGGLFFAQQSINYVINITFRKIFNTRSQETVDVCLEMFGCLQPERTIAIRKRKFFNKFDVAHNALCSVFVAIAKTELESCCTDV